MTIRDRIKDLRRVKASTLVPNGRNWRVHPDDQRQAMAGVLEEIGYAGALIVRELDDGRLKIIDGHLRAETTPDEQVPVLVLDVDEQEADKLLATYDPLAAMAQADSQKLGELLAGIQTESEAVQAMLAGLAEENGIDLFDTKEPTEDIGRGGSGRRTAGKMGSYTGAGVADWRSPAVVRGLDGRGGCGVGDGWSKSGIMPERSALWDQTR